jgi:hypothetical protein
VGSTFVGGLRVAYDRRHLFLEPGEDARVRSKLPLSDRPITVLSTRQTGEALDETVMMK